MTGRLRAVILDWAGTTVDHGSLAPVKTLQRVFEEFDLPISESEARRDMGIAKRSHISAILRTGRVAAEWQRLRGHVPAESDIEELYARFVPLQLSCLADYSAVLSEVPETVDKLRRRDLKIGSTTGYTRAMLDLLVEKAAGEGYAPDCSVSPDEAGAGRPAPFMVYEAAVRLQVYPLSAIVKVGDTASDIEEGLNAGTWTVGVTRTGNSIGLNQFDWNALSDEEQRSRLSSARAALEQAGAHYVIEDLSQLDAVLNRIESAA